MNYSLSSHFNRSIATIQAKSNCVTTYNEILRNENIMEKLKCKLHDKKQRWILWIDIFQWKSAPWKYSHQFEFIARHKMWTRFYFTLLLKTRMEKEEVILLPHITRLKNVSFKTSNQPIKWKDIGSKRNGNRVLLCTFQHVTASKDVRCCANIISFWIIVERWTMCVSNHVCVLSTCFVFRSLCQCVVFFHSAVWQPLKW